jgi:endonuclease/exonuclease/phosphatase family metal-dependent hydrolase
MPASEEITLVTSDTPGGERCTRLKTVLRRLVTLATLSNLPPGLRHAVAVAQPPGRATRRAIPAITPRQACDGITVLTANLWHDFPRYRTQEARLERFARLVEDAGADILLLQEVARRPGLYADHWLAGRLGMAYVYTRANGHAEIGFEEGLAVFSRFPLGQALLRQLGPGCNPFVRRLALGSTVQTACGPLLAFSVHLALGKRQNWAQVKDLYAWIESMPEQAALVVGGDFNAAEHSPQIRHARSHSTDTFRHIHPHTEAVTHELRWPWGPAWLRHRLDYIFVRPGCPAWQVVEARLLETPGGAHSDHRSMLARLIPAEANSTPSNLNLA